jgi:Phage gp6-like head-tail connector protein
VPQILHLQVDNPAELLNAGAYGAGALIRVQVGATETGAFADVAGAGSTPTIPLVAATFEYTAYDPTGTSASWYRYRFENAGATRLGDWSAAFQNVGDNLLVSLADMRHRLEIDEADHDDDELLLDLIGETTDDIEDYCGRWFIPRPAFGTTTVLMSPRRDGTVLEIPRGIRSLTSLGYATIDQPDAGGAFTAIDVTQVSLQPGAMDRERGWPATEIVLLETLGIVFYAGTNRVQIVGGLGFAAPPRPIVSIAKNVIIRRFVGKASGVAQVVGAGAMGGSVTLRWVSPEEHDALYRYRDGLI